MQEAEEVGRFEDILAEWARCYTVCKIKGLVATLDHEIEAYLHREKEEWE